MQQLAALLQIHHVRVIDLFRALDKNADGQVTRSELGEALRSLGISGSRDEVDELFDSLDDDQSGSLDSWRRTQDVVTVRPGVARLMFNVHALFCM